MPIYDYICDHCGHAFSAVQSYTDATLDTCPSCGKRPRKVMATPAIVFKGSGWYKTDSRAGSKAAKADAKAESGDVKVAQSETKAGAETKTSEPKTETAVKPAETKASSPKEAAS